MRIIENIVDEESLCELLGVRNASFIDFKAVKENLLKNFPELKTLTEITSLKLPEDKQSFLEFVSDLRNNYEYDFREPYIGKVREMDSFEAIPFYNEHPEIKDHILALYKAGEIDKELKDWCISSKEIKAESDPFRQASYFIYIEKVCDEIRQSDLSLAFENSIEDVNTQVQEEIKTVSKGLVR